MRLPKPALALTLSAAVLLAGCSSGDDDPLTEANIQERVSEAQREAGTFGFEWTDPATDDGPGVVTVGEIEYDDGEVAELALTIDEDAKEYRFVDETLYLRSAAGDFHEVGGGEASALLQSWDWAQAAEAGPAPETVTDKGEQEVDGVTATEYELEFEDHTTTWWVDEDDRLVKWVDGESEATLTDYGDPVDVSAPE